MKSSKLPQYFIPDHPFPASVCISLWNFHCWCADYDYIFWYRCDFVCECDHSSIYSKASNLPLWSQVTIQGKLWSLEDFLEPSLQWKGRMFSHVKTVAGEFVEACDVREAFLHWTRCAVSGALCPAPTSDVVVTWCIKRIHLGESMKLVLQPVTNTRGVVWVRIQRDT